MFCPGGTVNMSNFLDNDIWQACVMAMYCTKYVGPVRNMSTCQASLNALNIVTGCRLVQ